MCTRYVNYSESFFSETNRIAPDFCYILHRKTISTHLVYEASKIFLPLTVLFKVNSENWRWLTK